jgi:hypothetical protein
VTFFVIFVLWMNTYNQEVTPSIISKFVIIEFRDMKLSNLGTKQSKPMYYSGGSYKNGSVWLNQCIENAQFWKTKIQ